MTLFNVAQPVVALIDATDEAAACAELAARLRRAGFEPHGVGDAFISDDQDETPDPEPAPGRLPTCDQH